MVNLPDFSRYGDVVREAPTVVADPTNPEAFGGLPKQGDTGDTVFKVQQALADRNISSVGEVDGAFGNKTSLGIQEFQGQVGLPRTGVLDQATYTQLVETPPSFDEEGKVQVTPIEKPDFSAFGEVVTADQGAAPQEAVPVAGEAQEDTFLRDLTEFLKEEEGFRAEPYRATQGEEHLTIGYGHYGSDVKQGQRLTQQEAEALLVQDINQRLPAVRDNIPAFDNLSSNLKVQIAQSWFRGGISGSPNTIRLINQGKFSEAADEFLDNDEYRNAEQRGRKGVIARMDGLANALRAEAD